MSRGAVLRVDLRLQQRYGFYAAYAFIAAVYIGLLHLLPADMRLLALPPVLLSEATVIGFFFAGTLLHLERSDGVLTALAVTPLTTGSYLLSKMLSLSVLTALVALVIGWATAGARAHAPLLAAGAVLTAAIFVALGLVVAARFRALDRFAVWGGLGTAVFGLPVLPWFGVAESPAWWLFPTHASLVLLGRALGADAAAARTGGAAAAIALVVLAGWTVLAFLLARRALAARAFGRGRAARGAV